MRIRSMLVKLAAGVGIVASLAVVGSPSAFASHDAFRPGTMAVSATSGPPGSVVSIVSQTPCPEWEADVRVWLSPTNAELPTVLVSDHARFYSNFGDWSASFTVPADIALGGYTILAECSGPTDSTRTSTTAWVIYRAPFTVTPPAPAAAPGFAVSPSRIDFGNGWIGGTVSRTVTVTNSGNANLKIDTTVFTGPNAAEFKVGADTCSGHVVAPGGVCQTTVRWTSAAHAPVTANLVFADNTGTSPHAVPLTGRGCYVILGTICV